MQFIINNLGTIAVSLLLLGIVAAIIIVTVRNKKRGKTTCGCGCSNCAMSSVCHKQDGAKPDEDTNEKNSTQE